MLCTQALTLLFWAPKFIFQVFSPCFNHVKIVEGEVKVRTVTEAVLLDQLKSQTEVGKEKCP